MKFVKLEALGIDYIFIFGVIDRIRNFHAFVERMCDRHYGIGGEAVVFIDKASPNFKLRVYDKEGDETFPMSETLIAAGYFLFSEGYGDCSKVSVETLNGIRSLEFVSNGSVLEKVVADMGCPILNTKEIPVMIASGTLIGKEMEIGGESMEITALSFGEPDVVYFVEDIEKVDVSLSGQKIGTSAWFPKQADVIFVEIVNNDNITIREWKRNRGEVPGSVEGVAAALVASALNGKCSGKAKVYQRGGVVEAEWLKENNHVYVAGVAHLVFMGKLNEDRINILLQQK